LNAQIASLEANTVSLEQISKYSTHLGTDFTLISVQSFLSEKQT